MQKLTVISPSNSQGFGKYNVHYYQSLSENSFQVDDKYIALPGGISAPER